MSENTVTFAPHRRPTLAPGDYEITVTHHVTTSQSTDSFEGRRTFSVGGDRFTLPPTAIRSVFPPEGSLGDHSDVLPHVVLDRPSLPWERDPGGGSATATPWLALLLFAEGEEPTVRVTTLGELAAGGKLPPAAVTPERHDSTDDPVTIIDVNADVLADVLASYPDLRLLAHVRGGTGSAADADAAVVVANRLPPPGQTSTMHLVSLEQRFRDVGAEAEFVHPPAGTGGATVPTVPLISLASWRFACLSDEHSFPALVRDLVKDRGTLRLAGTGDATADRYLAQGFVPVRHRLRRGGRSAGWYRGPLVPGPSDGPVPPRRSADASLRYLPDVGMFDLSYAAAWQLGRLLALHSTEVSTTLYARRRRRDARAKRADTAAYPLSIPDLDTALPKGTVDWLQALARLEGVPFSYLLPDERLVPRESIRFVGLDQRWVRQLVDGATSIGRLGPPDEARDAEDPPPVEYPTVTGALLRSAIVPGYQGLLIDGYADRDGTQPLTQWRRVRLTTDILLCLFRGELARLDLHQPPEQQHLAVEVAASTPSDGTAPWGVLSKNLRAHGGGEATGDRVGPLPLGPRRTILVTALVQAMADALGTDASDFHSGDLALQLTETADRVTFMRPPAE